jgi:hypothetical protein
VGTYVQAAAQVLGTGAGHAFASLLAAAVASAPAAAAARAAVRVHTLLAVLPSAAAACMLAAAACERLSRLPGCKVDVAALALWGLPQPPLVGDTPVFLSLYPTGWGAAG